MTGAKKVKSFPSHDEIFTLLRYPADLVALGDSAIEQVTVNQHKYDPKWVDTLLIAVGTLKDAVKSNIRINTAAAALALILLRPMEVGRSISNAEMSELYEPSEDEIEAWAWGEDIANTSKWFVAFAVLAIISLLAFAVVTFGLESPGSMFTIIFLSVGVLILTGATLVLGAGLYRNYVVSGYISWKSQSYSDAEVRRNKKYYRSGGWYAYIIGGFFLALSIALAIIEGKQLPYSTMLDYESVRLVLLFSMAIGLVFFAIGAWPILRNIVAKAEAEKRLGRAKYMASPRLLLTLLPIFTGTLSLLISWLFH